jgi:hypothetical protein
MDAMNGKQYLNVPGHIFLPILSECDSCEDMQFLEMERRQVLHFLFERALETIYLVDGLVFKNQQKGLLVIFFVCGIWPQKESIVQNQTHSIN